jgi:glycosyltransferase involved in cell wall biosynthesis
MSRALIVTNIPSPYREQVYTIVAEVLGKNNFAVAYCQKRESDREWNFMEGSYRKIFLKERVFHYKKQYLHHVHINPDIWRVLNRENPEIVITSSYNPTQLITFIWCIFHRKAHIAMTDGWQKSEEDLIFIHRLVRRIILKRSKAFIGASKRSIELFTYYGCEDRKIFQSHLCADNKFYQQFIGAPKIYDIIFSGQFISRKCPMFFANIAQSLGKLLRRKCKALIMGSGPLKDQFLSALKECNVDFFYPGFVNQAELPAYYASGKVFLFPTESDPWGIVVNEACAVGLPIITCENTAVAHELVIHSENGFILPLEVELWAQHAHSLIMDSTLYQKYSIASLQRVQEYSYENAAQGIVAAISSASGESNSAIK